MQRADRFKPVPEQPRGKRGKDTKRWCRGVVGREHRTTVKAWKWALRRNGDRDMGWPYVCDQCDTCGKVMRVRMIGVGEAWPVEVAA